MLEGINRFFGNRERETQLAGLFEQIQLQIEKKANEQKAPAKITSFMEETRRIATSCDMFKSGLQGYKNQDMFVILGLEILQYEPELGFAILSQMNRLEPEIGYKPFGRIMTTLSHMDSIKHAPIMTRFSYMKQRPELARLVDEKDYRCLKAGSLIAVGILATGRNIKGAADIYRKNDFEPMVKTSLHKTLRNWSPVITERIIG